MRILIVDDDKTSRAFFRRELMRGGYEIIEATDGFEALHTIHEHEVSLVILDIEMPDMDGYQVCALLRGEQFSSRLTVKSGGLLPIIFVTSDESMESRLRGFRAGATEFISKGFKPGRLLEIVDRILKPANLLKGMNALVVDDSPLVLDLVTRMLKEQGVKVFSATNGKEGYETLTEHLDEIDMVITDLEMPVMKGDEFCLKIRKDLGLRELPVIFLTAIPDHDILINLFKAGANDYLVKPFVKEELIARLQVTKEMLMALEGEVAERKRVQKDLVQTRELARAHEHAAGKAHFATSALHNVNNVINSLRVSCAQVDNFVSASRLNQLLLAVRLMGKHKDELPAFLTDDPKGAQLPAYFELVGDIMEDEFRQIKEEIKEMAKKVELISGIVEIQQKHATHGRDLDLHDLSDMINDAVKMNAQLIEECEVTVSIAFTPNLSITTSRTAFTHVLINLVKNACEAMEKAHERLLILKTSVTEGGQIQIEVRDTGEGIPHADLETIFQRGYTTKKGGHGFGLPYCAETIHQMSGEIWAESEGLGDGSAFMITVPNA